MTTARVLIFSRSVRSSQPCSSFRSPLTSVLNLNSTPFSQAFSASARFSPKGHTIPAAGAYNAAHTSSVRLGSISWTSFRFRIRMFLTPLAIPRSYKACSPGMSSSERQTTSEPIRSNEKSRSSDSCSISSLPLTLSFAMREPSCASYPAWTMALLALEVPQHTSSSFSNTQIFPSYRDSSRAEAAPDTPLPMITTSYIITTESLRKVPLPPVLPGSVPTAERWRIPSWNFLSHGLAVRYVQISVLSLAPD